MTKRKSINFIQLPALARHGAQKGKIPEHSDDALDVDHISISRHVNVCCFHCHFATERKDSTEFIDDATFKFNSDVSQIYLSALI